MSHSRQNYASESWNKWGGWQRNKQWHGLDSEEPRRTSSSCVGAPNQWRRWSKAERDAWYARRWHDSEDTTEQRRDAPVGATCVRPDAPVGATGWSSRVVTIDTNNLQEQAVKYLSQDDINRPMTAVGI